MYQNYKDKAEFILVYIREAHPDSELRVIRDGKEVIEKVPQTDTLKERNETAQQCMAMLKLTMPAVVDKEDNKVNSAYSGWPERLVVIDKEGKVAYPGRPGPSGFKPAEVRKWLEENVK